MVRTMTDKSELEELNSDIDPLYDQAVEVVLKNHKASISLVQRHLKISYNQASRLVDHMESAGLVSSANSFGLREILEPPPFIGKGTKTEIIDKALIREMVEDYWRSFIFMGRQNPSAGAGLIKRFDERIASMASLMETEKASLFLAAVETERERLFTEYERNPDALRDRLNIQPIQQQATPQATLRRGQGFVGLVAKTAVRATVWEIVRSLFRR